MLIFGCISLQRFSVGEQLTHLLSRNLGVTCSAGQCMTKLNHQILKGDWRRESSCRNASSKNSRLQHGCLSTRNLDRVGQKLGNSSQAPSRWCVQVTRRDRRWRQHSRTGQACKGESTSKKRQCLMMQCSPGLLCAFNELLTWQQHTLYFNR